MIDFESYYLFGGKTYKDLRIGSAMIEEVLAREVKKAEEEAIRRERDKEEDETHRRKVCTHCYTCPLELTCYVAVARWISGRSQIGRCESAA